MNLKAISFFFFLMGWSVLPFISLGYSNPDSISYDQKLSHGIEAFYESDWEEASAIFKKLQEAAPSDARAYFFYSMIPFWQYYFGDQSQEAANLYLERSEKALSVSHKQLESNSRDTTMILMLSGLYGYRSLIAASEENYKTAVSSGLDGFKYTRTLLSLDSSDPKALIGKGMFYYMIGSVPSQLKWATNLAGISGNMEEGFQALESAARSDSYVRNDAKMILAYLYERENEFSKSLEHLEDLSEDYPENIIFQFNLGRIYEQIGKRTLAEKKYQLVLDMDTNYLKSIQRKSEDRLKVLRSI
jgi:tetratricopeptide (TPR) repeat protein